MHRLHAFRNPRDLAILAVLALLACSAVTLAATFVGPRDPELDAYRTAFDAGVAGWRQFEVLSLATSTDHGRALVMKTLVVRVKEADRQVYFIPNATNPLHYTFAHQQLRMATGAHTRTAFDWNTYVRPDRDQLATQVTWYPDLTVPANKRHATLVAPVVLQFAATDLATPEEIISAYGAHKMALAMTGDSSDVVHPLLYTAAGGANGRVLAKHAAELEAAGVQWIAEDELGQTAPFQAMNPGLAYGWLRTANADDLREGSVSHGDILVLDYLPLDLPPVAGTITTAPQTPLAHVNVVAVGRGTPNMSLAGALADERVSGLLDQLVRFEVRGEGFTLVPATAEEVERFQAAQAPPARKSPAADLESASIRDLDELGFGDARAYGGKAANLAELRHALGDMVPGGLAVPFHAYHEHMNTWQVSAQDCDRKAKKCADTVDAAACSRAADECRAVLGAAETMSAADYAERVSARPAFAADSRLRAALLFELRTFIERQTLHPDFAAALDNAAAAKFGTAAFRLRSSSTGEDLLGYTGAGLYDSVTAQAGGDDSASRRIQEVWASAFGWRAVESRLLAGLRPDDVVMGVLINRAFPEELCNGVLVTRNLVSPESPGFYVNIQRGETSVTNALPGEVPAELVLLPAADGTWAGGQPTGSADSAAADCLTATELSALGTAAQRAHEHFSQRYGLEPTAAAFELEFKIHDAARRLYIKQIRPYADVTGQ
jgi:hypothetical protein